MQSTRGLSALLSLASLLAANVSPAFAADGPKPATAPVVEGKPTQHAPDAAGWIHMFDGKTLSGWETFDPGHWTVDKDGTLVGQGSRSHLFSPKSYRNLEFKAEAKLNNKGNSGMYFRAKLGPGWPEGYEAQVENTSSDPQRTGSLYNRAKMLEQLIQDDTWWTQHIIAIGNRVIIKVNDKIVVDFIDEKKSFMEGHVALQQHNDGSIVQFRNVVVKPLPDDEAAALAIARKDMPDVGAEPLVKTRK
jgi:hypothetical protein